jgi:SSS family solute:Na+ symporter
MQFVDFVAPYSTCDFRSATYFRTAAPKEGISTVPSGQPRARGLCSRVSLSPTNAFALFIVAVYLSAAIAIGYKLRRHSDTASEFLHARGSLPVVITSLAFLAANCGALDIIGIVATSAKYGILALHFYWIGAIPAMLALSLLMMPVYARSGAMTVPDFIRMRYNDATHILCCALLSVMMVLVAGISIYAIATVLRLFFGWNFTVVAIVAASVVFTYAFTGGLKATIYNEIFQLGLTVAGLAPMAIAVYRQFHGSRGILLSLPQSKAHIWATLPLFQPRTASMDVFGVVFGLGFVLSFGYWCTDFVLIQRALASKTVEGAIRTPLFAAIPKLLFPWLVIFPGAAASIFLNKSPHPQFDYALPLLMQHYYGYALTGLGISAILASLMSGLAGNVSAFSALWTHDLYKTHLRQLKDDAHYLAVGRTFTALAICLSVGTAYIVLLYNNLMDYLQFVFSLFNSPLFAVFLFGMFTCWATPSAGFWGLLSGVIAASLHGLFIRCGLIVYGSQMLGNFYGAIYGWAVAAAVLSVTSLFTAPKEPQNLDEITYFTGTKPRRRITTVTWVLVVAILIACAATNFIYR